MRNPLDVRSPGDPFGRTHRQVMQNALEERAREFRARWGDKIQIAPNGMWYVYEGGRLYTLTTSDQGTPWP